MIFIFLLIALVVGVTAGGFVVRRRSIAYKKRWQEALDLVKQLNDGATTLPRIGVMAPAPPENKWRLDIQYTDKYANFYAVKGKKRQYMGDQYDPYFYQSSFDSEVRKRKNMIKKMNEAATE